MMGSHLAELLASNGEEVTATYFNPTVDMKGINVAGFTEVNVLDWTSVFDSLKATKPTWIFHLAAQSYPTVSWARPTETLTTNIIGTVNVFEAVRRLELDARIVVACSSAEYGSIPVAELPVREDHVLQPLHPYGVSKVGQDLLAYQYFANFGMDCLRARIFNCTGPRKVGDAVSDFARRIVSLEREPNRSIVKVGNLHTRRAIVDVRDLNMGLVALAESGRAGEAYNLGGLEPHRIGDLLSIAVKHSTRTDLEVLQVDELLRPSDEAVIWGDITKVATDTGWRPMIGINETIVDVLDYWRSKADLGSC